MGTAPTGTEAALLDAIQRFLDNPGCNVEVALVDGRYAVQIVRRDDYGKADQDPRSAIRPPVPE